MLEGDYWRVKEQMDLDAANMFDTKTMSEQDYMNATKNLTMRMRLNRDLQFNKGFSDKHLINAEYGNYEKYQKNSVTHKNNETNQVGDD